jgi:hypothetical protein
VSSVVLSLLFLLGAGTGPAAVDASHASSDCWTRVPREVRDALHISYPGLAPLDGACKSYVSADFIGDGRAAHAILMAPHDGAGESSLVVITKQDTWTLSVLREWAVGAAPRMLRVVPPGRYVRSGGLLETPEADEMSALTSRRPGFLAGAWAYFWDGHRWVSVRLSR